MMKYIGRIPPLPDWDTAAARIRAAYILAFPNLPDDFWLSHTKLSMRETKDGSIIPDMDLAIGTTLRKSYRSMKFARFLSRFGMMKKTAALIKNGYWSQFRAMNMPILLLRGDLSDVLPLKLAKQMKQAQPTMRVTSVHDRGHAPFLDEPESMAALESFLERNRED
jgi:pimeloyl-ACP methyl ester carboxylesterase